MTEIRLDDLRSGDRIVVRTLSSTYSIDVIDAPARVVSVSGGTLLAPRLSHLIGRLEPLRYDEASIAVGSSIAYTYMDRSRSSGLLHPETSEVTAIELHRPLRRPARL